MSHRLFDYDFVRSNRLEVYLSFFASYRMFAYCPNAITPPTNEYASRTSLVMSKLRHLSQLKYILRLRKRCCCVCCCFSKSCSVCSTKKEACKLFLYSLNEYSPSIKEETPFFFYLDYATQFSIALRVI